MQIDLASAPDFRLGEMRVSPSTREVFAAPGRELLEPRVMQVLVALARAQGHTVSRDQLIEQCWDGLVVGDDAINRVIGKLRKLATTSGAFEIETITKVGYRLSESPATAAGVAPVAPPGEEVAQSQAAGRRPWLPVTVAALVGLAGFAGWAWQADRTALPAAGPSAPAGPPDSVVEELVRLGSVATREHMPQRVEQGVAQLREATVRDPKSARAWGALAAGYTALLNRLPFAEQATIEARAREAIDQALALDPKQPDALMAKARLVPMFGNWAQVEALEKAAIAASSDGWPMRGAHSRFRTSVGLISEALPDIERAQKRYSTGLYPKVSLQQALWVVGRVDEADLLAEESLRLYPRNYLPWFNNAYLLMYSGRPSEAVRFVSDPALWPDDVPKDELALVKRMAEALASNDPAKGDALIAEFDALAPQGRGYIENAIRIAAALGRPDDAFRYMEMLYLTPQDQLPTTRFRDQRNYGRPGERLTELLFQPPVDTLHGDPRFLQLLTRMGMVDYWRKSGKTPDFCRDQASACRRAGIRLSPSAAS